MTSLSAQLTGKVLAIGRPKGELRVATKRDIPQILKLYYEEGWVDYSHDELEYLFDTSPNGCLKLVLGEELIGVNFVTLVGNGICYPHSNLLASAWRSKVNYFDEATKYNEYVRQLASLSIVYAARKVIRLYQAGGGYRPLCTYRRASIDASARSGVGGRARPATPEDRPAILAFCRSIYKSDREQLFRYFVDSGMARPFVLADDAGQVRAFAMVRRLPKHQHVGPVLAHNDEDAADVLRCAARSQPDATVMMDGEETKLGRLLDGRFQFHWEENVMLKMFRGDPALLEDEQSIYGVFARYTS